MTIGINLLFQSFISISNFLPIFDSSKVPGERAKIPELRTREKKLSRKFGRGSLVLADYTKRDISFSSIFFLFLDDASPLFLVPYSATRGAGDSALCQP